MGKNKIIKLSFGTIRFDMRDFINAVRREDILWNRNCPKFHSRGQREISWIAVARTLYKAIDKLHTAERREIIEALIKRWKNARDSFLRVHRLKTKERNPDTPNYIYDEELQFLLTGNGAVVQNSAAAPPTNANSSKDDKTSPTRKSQRLTTHERDNAIASTSGIGNGNVGQKNATSTSSTTVNASSPKKQRHNSNASEKANKYLCATLSIDDYSESEEFMPNDEHDDDLAVCGNLSNDSNDADNSDIQHFHDDGGNDNAANNTRSSEIKADVINTETNREYTRVFDGMIGTIINTQQNATTATLDTRNMASVTQQSPMRNRRNPIESNGSRYQQHQQQPHDNATMFEYVMPSSTSVAATASDPDQAFFDSIKPMVRAMDTTQKLDFQIEVLKLLKTFRSN